MVQNKGLIYRDHPVNFPEAGKHIVVETRDFDLNQQPPPGGFTCKVHYVSFDPYQRGRMRSPEIKSYSPPFEIGGPVTNTAIVTVLKSDHAKFKENDLVWTMCGTEEYSVVSEQLAGMARVVDNPFGIDPKKFLGALGMPGLTAYSSFYEIGAPKKGETIFISAASGAVGQIVGQLAKHEGLTVIGSVGDDKKLEFITKELGFDAGFNYKKESAFDALPKLAPNGLDIYYENVGGEQLEAALANMNTFGRIVACGMISQYNKPPSEAYAVNNLMNVVKNRIKMQGFIVSDKNMGPKYAVDHQKNIQKWLHDGTFKSEESVTTGIDNAADGLIGMLNGKNFGKALLEVSPL